MFTFGVYMRRSHGPVAIRVHLSELQFCVVAIKVKQLFTHYQQKTEHLVQRAQEQKKKILGDGINNSEGLHITIGAQFLLLAENSNYTIGSVLPKSAKYSCVYPSESLKGEFKIYPSF